MSTTTDWDLGPDPYVDRPKGKKPYAPDAPAQPTSPEEAPEPPPAPRLSKRERRQRREANPFAHWFGDMRDDIAARKERSDGRWWLMRWMGEQPTSVRDYADFLLHQREKRPNGGRGWGLRTEALLIDGIHAFVYVTYGLLIGLPLTMAAYAFGWLAQRPGRFALFVGLLIFVITNLSDLG